MITLPLCLFVFCYLYVLNVLCFLQETKTSRSRSSRLGSNALHKLKSHLQAIGTCKHLLNSNRHLKLRLDYSSALLSTPELNGFSLGPFPNLPPIFFEIHPVIPPIDGQTNKNVGTKKKPSLEEVAKYY